MFHAIKKGMLEPGREVNSAFHRLSHLIFVVASIIPIVVVKSRLKFLLDFLLLIWLLTLLQLF